MTNIGYTLSSEERGPNTLVENAVRAQAAGFGYALISDHFHPWTSTQGNAPFVWSTLGAVAEATDSLDVGTGVTCPTVRMHPAVTAHAVATTAAMFDGRFFFGVGTGENLNEHVTGDRWPPFDVRLEMLIEAVEIMRKLWTGENVTHRGDHYTVENARLFTLPEEPPPIYVSGTGPKSTRAARDIGDGLVSTAPKESLVETFTETNDGPRYGQMTVCYAESESEAREIAHEWWPNVALAGEVGQLLPTPKQFEQAVEMVTEDDVAELVACGPDPDDHIELIEAYADAGFDHVYVHQVGPDQEGFFDLYENEILPSY
ncbi:TIGR03557 family F420-dependent LLM class oxidoreductase [Halocatena pleomorpha]|uniref:TIGR03557 family F420-dependent LLM class oxidoreductase n=1 Tax=Halocatena pleomorpha TaxID=1785090 RepID=A0A3P3RLQ3_9EURY|nr:TIGR03557 family F420-dependent LLM class oxidoreductase [Halocatena pleomorpha]RRJ33780.1 TIGR03557 family F420-dependent LLM class oxidoreductase [Halocatena pleomorpha]